MALDTGVCRHDRRNATAMQRSACPVAGFTLVELTIVLVLLGLLASVAVPRFIDLGEEARTARLENIAGVMQSTITIVRAKAHASGLSPAESNPGGNVQTGFAVDFGFGTTEVDWRNLCPESRAEVGDRLTMLDFLSIDADGTRFRTNVTNRSTFVGFDLGTCYVEYDSFDCEVRIVATDCT